MTKINTRTRINFFLQKELEGIKTIKIDGIEGRYYVENNELLFVNDDIDECQVSDLTELKIWQYDRLVTELNEHYPNYPIKHLQGDFI